MRVLWEKKTLFTLLPAGEDEQKNGPLEEGIVDDVMNHFSPMIPRSHGDCVIQASGPKKSGNFFCR